MEIIRNNGKDIPCEFICFCKKISLIHVCELQEDMVINSMEGSHQFDKGDFIATNLQDHQMGITTKSWGIKRQTFLNTYEPVMDSPNLYKKKPIIVKAYRLLKDSEIVSSEGEIFDGKNGDLLIVESENNMWVIKEEVWKETYQIVSQ